MRDPKRIDRICAKLAEVWSKQPDLRLGQLISNLMGTGKQDVFYTEDDEWEEMLNNPWWEKK